MNIKLSKNKETTTGFQSKNGQWKDFLCTHIAKHFKLYLGVVSWVGTISSWMAQFEKLVKIFSSELLVDIICFLIFCMSDLREI